MFPGVVSGRLRPYKSWRPIEQATMAYGYGLSVSLFQLAHAYTVFARDGELAPVSMIKSQGPVAGMRGAFARVLVAGGEGSPADAAPGDPARRHFADGTQQPMGLWRGRQVRHRLQAGRQGLRHQQIPFAVRGHCTDRQAAHHRGGDGRRAQRPASTSAATCPRRCSSARWCSRRCACWACSRTWTSSRKSLRARTSRA